MNTRAKWVEGVKDLYAELDQAGDYLTVTEVAAQIGLSPNTVTDLLSRAPITAPGNHLAPISRPAARIGNRPLYSQEQVDEVRERQRSNGHRHLGGGKKPLVSISPAEARSRGLVSASEIAALAVSAKKPDGMHEQGVRRWARERNDFPAAVALRSRENGHAGVPEVMFRASRVKRWLIKHGYRDAEYAERVEMELAGAAG